MKKLLLVFILGLISTSGFCVFTGTTSDGDWSDPNIWFNGILPDNADTIQVSHYINLDADINLENQTLIVIKDAVLCGPGHYINISYDGYLQNYGYIGVDDIFVDGGTFTNDGTTYSIVTVTKKGVFNENVLVNQSTQACPDKAIVDTTSPINPVDPTLQPILVQKDTAVICPGEKLDLDLPYSLARYEWSNGTTNSEFSPTEQGQYFVTIYTLTDTIQDSLVVIVKETEVIIPNIFTPNDDQINDQFLASSFKLEKLRLYNRWGREVFNTDDPDDIGYRTLNDGTYFYTIEHFDECFEINPIKGWVEIRK